MINARHPHQSLKFLVILLTALNYAFRSVLGGSGSAPSGLLAAARRAFFLQFYVGEKQFYMQKKTHQLFI